MNARDNIHVLDNVTVTLTDIRTGKTRTFSTHNIPLTGHFKAISSWEAGINNTGYNPVPPPTQIVYGNGSGTPAVGDTGCFSTISGSTTNLSYAQANNPSDGTTTFVFQTNAGVVTAQITEAYMQDVNGIGHFHAMFSSAFTPSSTETITTKWETTTSS